MSRHLLGDRGERQGKFYPFSRFERREREEIGRGKVAVRTRVEGIHDAKFRLAAVLGCKIEFCGELEHCAVKVCLLEVDRGRQIHARHGGIRRLNVICIVVKLTVASVPSDLMLPVTLPIV